MAAVQGSDQAFAANLYDLVDLQKDKFPPNYSTDLKDVDRLGISLPKLEIPKGFKYRANSGDGGAEAGADKVAAVKLTLKSIKPPHKFQVILEAPLANTIYKLKEDLIASNADFKGFAPANFKFLIKGKVLNDSSFLKDYTSEDAAVTVFTTAPEPGTVTEPAPAPVAQQEQQEEQEPEVSVPDPLQITAGIWAQFKTVLLGNGYSESDADTVLARLKDGAR